MLEYLEIENAGPADYLRLDLAPRLNLLTGDNGLGKSFLLDAIWWILTYSWPYEINYNSTSGRVLLPKNRELPTFIKYKKPNHNEIPTEFIPSFQSWHRQPDNLFLIEQKSSPRKLVIYSQIENGFSVSDYARNISYTEQNLRLQQAQPYVFSPEQLWNGLKTGEQVQCNGLIRDWSNWQRENNSNFQILQKVLHIISTSTLEYIRPSVLTRVSLDDVRDIPTIAMPYGDVPVLHASAGMRRILALIYLLVWSWEEHKIACKARQYQTAEEITFLIDEIEAHLHPKWQRTIVKSLMEVMKILAPEVKVQIIAATHSPLVMASVEPFFDPAQDAWFDLDLNRETGQVEVVKRSEHWYRRGDADAWLKSEAFDQKSGYAPETEHALENAGLAMQSPDFDKGKAQKIDIQLRRLLSDIDPFWIRWRYICEKRGWLN